MFSVSGHGRNVNEWCLEFSTATPTRSPESFASVTGVTVNWGVIRTLLLYWKRQNKARVIWIETLSRFWFWDSMTPAASGFATAPRLESLS